jgi:hypothetical protein
MTDTPSLVEALPRYLAASPERRATVDRYVAAVLNDTVIEEDVEEDLRLFDFTESGRLLHLSRTTVWRLVREKRLKTVEVRRGSLRIPASELRRFTGRDRKAPPARTSARHPADTESSSTAG